MQSYSHKKKKKERDMKIWCHKSKISAACGQLLLAICSVGPLLNLFFAC